MFHPIALYRYDGAGNDFLIADREALAQLEKIHDGSVLDQWLPRMAREWCDRRGAASGGADGFLLILPATLLLIVGPLLYSMKGGF